jgi:hypothetical protein
MSRLDKIIKLNKKLLQLDHELAKCTCTYLFNVIHEGRLFKFEYWLGLFELWDVIKIPSCLWLSFVISSTTFCIWLCLQLHCNYLVTSVFFITPFEQFLTWFSFKKTQLCSISYRCGKLNCNPQCILSVSCV